MTRLSEKRDVQDALVNHLIGIGWEYLPPDEIMNMRNGDEEPFLLPIAREQLIALNPSTGLPSATLGTGRAGPGLITPETVDHLLRMQRMVAYAG